MIVLLHVTIALLSMASATYTFLSPSKAKLRVSYGLVGATFASGTYLVLSTHSALVSACLAGLTYLGFATAALVSARYRLAGQADKIPPSK